MEYVVIHRRWMLFHLELEAAELEIKQMTCRLLSRRRAAAKGHVNEL